VCGMVGVVGLGDFVLGWCVLCGWGFVFGWLGGVWCGISCGSVWFWLWCAVGVEFLWVVDCVGWCCCVLGLVVLLVVSFGVFGCCLWGVFLMFFGWLVVGFGLFCGLWLVFFLVMGVGWVVFVGFAGCFGVLLCGFGLVLGGWFWWLLGVCVVRVCGRLGGFLVICFLGVGGCEILLGVLWGLCCGVLDFFCGFGRCFGVGSFGVV